MIIAQQKFKENIAEYLLYMYQVEDLIRANHFDIARIDQSIISQFDAEYDKKREMLEWYKGIVHDMIAEKKQKLGHIEMLTKLTDQLNELNTKILHNPLNNDFKDAYDKAKINIEALRMRSGYGNENDVQLALNGLYGLLILKIQKKEISPETEKAFSEISGWMALLSEEWRESFL